jgi:hypothetical protein
MERMQDLFPDTTLCVCTIPHELTEAEVLDLLPDHREIRRASFPQKEHGRRFGFIAYSSR